MKPRAFIASSSEGLKLAKALKKQIAHEFDCKIWSEDDVFTPSGYTLDSLIEQISLSDLGIFVLTGDDTSRIRDKDYIVGRDNVLFEAGLFWGALGRENSFLLRTGEKTFHVPTDLLGLTELRLGSGTPVAAVKKAGTKLVNLRTAPKASNLGPALCGKWKQNWKVEGSKNFPSDNSSSADVIVFGTRIRAKWKVGQETYRLTGRILPSHVIVGEWSGPTSGHYCGSFQLLLNPKMNGMTGSWVGFRENKKDVHAGQWSWQKKP